jgi:TATA-binding protein-associated factor
VIKTLHSFMTVPSLPRDWLAAPFLRLLFQNLVVEERSDIRDATLNAWRTALSILSASAGWLENVVTQQLLLEWYAILMTPLGVPIDTSAFYSATVAADGMDAAPERHNVDKNMLSQDLSLVTVEVTIKARVAAAVALAYLMVFWTILVCQQATMSRVLLLITPSTLGQRQGNSVPAHTRPLYRVDQHASKVPSGHHFGRVGSRARRKCAIVISAPHRGFAIGART